MSQSLDLPKNITSFYFWCKIQVLLYIQMKSASHTSIITALKFTCCSSLSVSYQQNCFILRTVHNYLWTRVPTHLCNRIQLLLYLVQMFLLCRTHPGEKPHRIFEDLQGLSKTCQRSLKTRIFKGSVKDLQRSLKIFVSKITC